MNQSLQLSLFFAFNSLWVPNIVAKSEDDLSLAFREQRWRSTQEFDGMVGLPRLSEGSEPWNDYLVAFFLCEAFGQTEEEKAKFVGAQNKLKAAIFKAFSDLNDEKPSEGLQPGGKWLSDIIATSWGRRNKNSLRGGDEPEECDEFDKERELARQSAENILAALEYITEKYDVSQTIVANPSVNYRGTYRLVQDVFNTLILYLGHSLVWQFKSADATAFNSSSEAPAKPFPDDYNVFRVDSFLPDHNELEEKLGKRLVDLHLFLLNYSPKLKTALAEEPFSLGEAKFHDAKASAIHTNRADTFEISLEAQLDRLTRLCAGSYFQIDTVDNFILVQECHKYFSALNKSVLDKDIQEIIAKGEHGRRHQIGLRNRFRIPSDDDATDAAFVAINALLESSNPRYASSR